MDDVPPPYEMATSRDPWKIVAPYAAPRDLFAASLVSKSFYCAFGPVLWGRPHGIFNLDLEDAYNVFESFLRALRIARVSTRAWTHTLDLSTVQPTLDRGPDKDWLLIIMSGLPNLQSFLVSGLPFVDAGSLQYLQLTSNWPETANSSPYKPWMIKLANCQNTTPLSLATALYYLPQVAYLDLSGTRAARDTSIFQEDRLPSIKILKLCNCAMTDKELSALARNLRTRVWSLDVRDNALTDESIDALLDYCFMPPDYDYSEGLPRYKNFASVNDRSLTVREENEVAADQEATFLARLIGPVDCSSLNRSRIGISRLYLSNNPVTHKGVLKLLQSTQLVVLDCGNVGVKKSHVYPRSAWTWEDSSAIITAYQRYAQDRLQYLRVDHTCVTSIQMKQTIKNTSESGRTQLCSDEAYERTNLLPSKLTMRYLVLAEVPKSSIGGRVSEAIINFLKDCAMAEAEWACDQSELNHDKERRQPSVNALQVERLSSEVFSMPRPFLGNLILEMADDSNFLGSSKNNVEPSEDITAAFGKALKGDFSFFEGEKQDISSGDTGPGAKERINSPMSSKVDVIEAITNFRKARLREYDDALLAGRGGPGAGGHWSGKVKVVRNLSTNKYASHALQEFSKATTPCTS